jgi:ADP-heptose:LPS heptosyltransferase
MHNFDRMADQLKVAGIGPAYAEGEAPPSNLAFAADLALSRAKASGRTSVAEVFGLKAPFALIVPGASASRPEKLWPVERYGEVARALIVRGLMVGVLGGREQAPLARTLVRLAPGAVDLTVAALDQLDIAGLAREAELVVGGDTGPVQVATYVGAPGVMLMSTRVSNPAHVGPRGAMTGIARADLADVTSAEVLHALEERLPPAP